MARRPRSGRDRLTSSWLGQGKLTDVMKAIFAILIISMQSALAAFTLADIAFWTGPDAGPGVHEAELVRRAV